MANKYCVIRTDLMSGTKQPADLVSIRFHGGDSHNKEVENGVFVELEGYEEGQREVIKAKAATNMTPFDKLAIVAGVEVNYDERLANLEDYINVAGKAVRAYIPRDRNVFSLTAEGFQGGVAPELNADLKVGTDGKLTTLDSGKGIGTCVAIEQAGRYTFYVIRLNDDLSK